jgi:excisionase family DNA binding protein
MMAQRHWSTTQVGERIGRSGRQVQRMIEAGLFPHATRPRGGMWRVPESDVVAWLESHRPRVRRRAS